jgi:hypothetical protein
MPDEELLAMAASGELADSETFSAQIDRLLASPRSRSLAEVFAVQWLLLDEIDNLTKEVPYAAALKGQPIEHIYDLIVRDRPLRELIDSRVEFVNLYLMGYYRPDGNQLTVRQRRAGVERETLPLERIELNGTIGRGGLLTMPGILMMNHGAIQRGTWMLQRILGEHLGEPPANVPPVKPAKPGQRLSFRERFAEHRANATCAACHDRIDPLGFAFEAYNEQGGFRLAPDAAQQRLRNVGLRGKPEEIDLTEIDASGTLPSGERFNNFEELKGILTGSQWPRIVENLVRQMYAYAMCRALQPGDEPIVEELTAKLAQPDATWRDLVREIAGSTAFRMTAFPPSDDTPSCN